MAHRETSLWLTGAMDHKLRMTPSWGQAYLAFAKPLTSPSLGLDNCLDTCPLEACQDQLGTENSF